MNREQDIALKTNPKERFPDHLVPLPDSRWYLWRCMALRSSGFPAHLVQKLSLSEQCALLVEEIFPAEVAVEQASQEAQQLINQALDQLREDGQWPDKSKRYPLLNALSALKQQKPSRSSLSVPAPIDQALQTWQEKRAHFKTLHKQFEKAFAQERDSHSQAIYELAQLDRLTEAILWQNQKAFRNNIKPLLHQPPSSGPGNRKQGRFESVVVSYLQRYCTKNDTIGYFGPVGWAAWDAPEQVIDVQAGPTLLSSRTVYFEQWGIDVLAQTIGQNKALRPWLTPRRLPEVYLRDGVLYSGRGPVTLSSDQAFILGTCLEVCDGRRTAQAVAAYLLQLPALPLKDEAQVYGILASMQDAGLIVWQLDVPFQVHPEQGLRQKIEQITETAYRQQALALLAQLENARKEVVQAAGNPQQLDQALTQLSETFTSLTSVPAHRAHGKTYGARTLVYEDCQRDVTVQVGSEILNTLAPALSLLLMSARWFTFQTAQRFYQIGRQVYQNLVRQTGSATIDLVSFWHQAQSILFLSPQEFVPDLLRMLQQRWADSLSLPPQQRWVRYTSAALRSQVRDAFAAPGGGWRFARYHSPDILIAADGLDAIRQGQFMFVLGEVHVGTNALRPSCLVQQHPSPETLTQWVAQDVPESLVIPLFPKNWPESTTRTQAALISPTKDFRLIFSPDPYDVPASRTLLLSDLVVEETEDGALQVRTHDGRLQFDLIEVLAEVISLQITNAFHIFPPAAYTPRVSIDQLVIQRESWCIPTSELSFLHHKDERHRFLEAQRLIKTHQMNQFLFAKVPAERKPLFVDFRSPTSLNILAKVINKNAADDSSETLITFTEMLPDFQQLWLPDAQGQRYTSEFRIVAVDQALE